MDLLDEYMVSLRDTGKIVTINMRNYLLKGRVMTIDMSPGKETFVLKENENGYERFTLIMLRNVESITLNDWEKTGDTE